MQYFHTIFERWILEASEGDLSAFKSRLTQAHLRHCARCSSLAVELAKFTGALVLKEDTAAESYDAQLHAEIMAAFHRQRKLAQQPGIRFSRAFGVTPGFAKAMGLVILSLGLIVMLAELNQPLKESVTINAAPKSAGPALPTPLVIPATVTATPTPALTATPSATPSPSASLSPSPQKQQKP